MIFWFKQGELRFRDVASREPRFLPSKLGGGGKMTLLQGARPRGKFLDLLMGLFRGAVFDHVGVPEKKTQAH